jgi:hypothetical protein
MLSNCSTTTYIQQYTYGYLVKELLYLSGYQMPSFIPQIINSAPTLGNVGSTERSGYEN